MPEINESIVNKLQHYSGPVKELAFAALELAENGLSEASIVEQLSSVVRQIAKKSEDLNDTSQS